MKPSMREGEARIDVNLTVSPFLALSVEHISTKKKGTKKERTDGSEEGS